MTDSSRPSTGPYDHEFDTPYTGADPIDESLFDSYAPLASPWTRLGAVILNGLILMATIVPGLILIGVGEDVNSDLFEGLGVLLIMGCMGGLVVYQTILLSRDGQSLGKRILNLRIVDANDDSNPGFARVILLRYGLMQVLSLIPFVSLVDALMVFTEEHRTLHDRLAGTIVVSERDF